MFTGIVKDVGRIADIIIHPGGDKTFIIETRIDLSAIELGASISCHGVCLTVVEKTNTTFRVDLSKETLAVTGLDELNIGSRLNIEPSLKIGDEIGGHFVSGHVDGRAEVLSRRPDGESIRFQIRIPDAFTRFMAPKGSVCLNGVSLTVNAVQGNVIDINIIPHTLKWTTFDEIQPGQKLNLEIDTLARYVDRLLEARKAA